MKAHALVLLVAGGIFVAGDAAALTLTNRDPVDQALVIVENGESLSVDIAPNETMTGFCNEGCSISLENGVEETFEGDEVVLIEDGEFVNSQ